MTACWILPSTIVTLASMSPWRDVPQPVYAPSLYTGFAGTTGAAGAAAATAGAEGAGTATAAGADGAAAGALSIGAGAGAAAGAADVSGATERTSLESVFVSMAAGCAEAVARAAGNAGVETDAGCGVIVAGAAGAGATAGVGAAASDGPGPPDRAIEAPGVTGPPGRCGICSSVNFSAAARVRT